MLQQPIKQGYIPGEFEQNVAAWKVSILSSSAISAREALGALNKSYHRSSLTAHVTEFLKYTEDNDNIKQMLGVMPECAALANGENAGGRWLDSRWNDVRIAKLAFFDARPVGSWRDGKNSVVRAALKAFGVPGKIMDDFLQAKVGFEFRSSITTRSETTQLADVIGCLMRNDKKYEDEKVPQN